MIATHVSHRVGEVEDASVFFFFPCSKKQYAMGPGQCRRAQADGIV